MAQHTGQRPATVAELLAPHAAFFAAEPAATGLVAGVPGTDLFAAIRRGTDGQPALLAVEASEEAAQASLDLSDNIAAADALPLAGYEALAAMLPDYAQRCDECGHAGPHIWAPMLPEGGEAQGYVYENATCWAENVCWACDPGRHGIVVLMAATERELVVA